MTKRPNILFLMADQHRADITGYEGNKIIKTPTLDRLADDGVVFKNAYTPSPVCVPGRQCMMSGQLPETCHCVGFWDDLKPNYMTFAKRFSQYAYNTVCSGKLHHHGPDQMQGWTKRLAPDADLAPRYVDGMIEEEFAKYKPAEGVGKWSNQRELEEARPGDGPYQQFDRLATDSALCYLTRYFDDPLYHRPENHRPLLFKLSLLQPHYPFFTTQEKFDYYYDKVPLFKEEPCDHPVLSLSQQNKPIDISDEINRRATAAYYGMIATIDEYYEQVLNKLEELGEDLDEWIIVYTSDHGEMLGEHGIWEKTRFYEGSVRVPLIIRYPKQFKGRVVEENVNLCDLFATLCELAGLETPDGLDSRSLVPLMHGDATNWNNESISQFNDHFMIKRDKLKYQYYGENIPEVLFDMDKDPGENFNVAEDPEYARAISEFRQRLSSLGIGPDADPNYVNAGY